MSDLTRSQWDTLLTDASGRTFGDLVAALKDADMVSVDDPDQCVDDAIASGPLEEDPDAGMFGEIHLDGEPPEPENTDDSDPEEPVSADTNPGSEPGESDTDTDTGEDLLAENIARVGGRVYPDGIKEREWWVCWILDEVGRKRPVAPWKDGHAYPTEWRGDLPEDEKPHTDFDTAKRWVDFDLADTGLALPPDAQSDELDLGILLPNERPALADRISLIDWDDVRDPDTGEIHPVAAEYIKEYGGYVEVSTSGKGLHQFVQGGLRKRGKFIAPIDDKPFVGDDLPQVEIYDGGRHVAMTGRHVAGTDRHIVENQSYIDSLVSDYADAEKDAGHRVYDPDSDEYENNNTLDTDASDTSDSAVPDPNTGEYIGPALSTLQDTKPEDRSLAYHATVETFYRGGGDTGGYAHIQNWRLEGFAAALGERADLTREQVKDDLAGAYLDDTDVECGCRHETPHRVDYGFKRAETDRLEPPSYSTLVAYGILPPEVTSDSEASSSDDGDDSDEEYRSDPTDLAATVDPRRAWDAAGRVSPSDLADHDLAVNDDAGSFACPCCGEPVDVVRAVAIDTGLVDSCEDSLDETYASAYDRARSLGAPLPEYYTEWDAIARFDALLDVIGEVTFWDLDTDAILSEVTGTDDDVNGDAVRTLNPSWRESDSEASVLVFPSGTIWDADTKRVLDAVRFAAVDSGLIEDPTAPVEGSTFTQAYRRCRHYYDAPLPRWNPAGGDRTVTPDLPDGRDLVDTRDVDGVNVDALENARERVENLVGDAVSLGGDTDNTPTVVTSLPATGKTTAAIKSARDGPRTYLAPRKELQQQAVDKADRWGVDAYVLPVLSEENIRSDVLERAVAFVREHDQQQLRNREAILEATMGAGEGEVQANEIFEEDDDDEDDDVDLDRATCPTAEGEHGAAWALAVHTAKKLGHTPQEIHMNAQGLFGESLPCTHDGTCEYGDAWSVVTSRDNCPELLVGSYGHAHVESVRTHYKRDDSGDGIERSPRPLVFDEFIGEAFTTELSEEALDFATWLARSLRADVADRRDMFDADLWSDPWVRSWLKGRLGESRESESNSDDPILAEVERVIHALSRVGDVLDARDSAADMVSEYGGALEELSVRSTLTEFVDGTTPADKVFGALEDLTEGSVDEDLQNIFEWIVRDVHVPLRRATKAGTEPADAGVRQVEDTSLPIGGDLADLVADAFDAAEVRGDAARARIEAAVTALQGGPDGCRRLAAWADDGYAHPDAHHVLRGVITPTGDDSDVADATRVNTSNWTFDPDADEGTVVDVVSTAGDATTIVDRNDHGARLHTPPSRTSGTGEQVPVVGLDATGRAALWRVVLGTEVRTTDIFDSARERRQFLEDALDLRVIQAADMPRYYEGDPATKDTDGDVALLEAIAEEYSGIQAPRQRGEEPQRFGSPAAITTKSVRDVLESDPRLDDVVDAWDNYGNVTGKNELGDHRLAAILGCQHFGDDTIEQFAALAGEEVDTDREVGRGSDLDYDSDVANAYLSHMTEDKTMQAILRFARGEDGGATVVARTSVLRDDLPVVGRGDVVETWSDTATNIVEKARSLGREFTSADVRPAVDVKNRQVRRVLGELVDAGYLQRTEGGPGRAHSYERVDDPGAGEVSIPERDDAVPDTDPPGRSSSNTYYTRNVRVFDPDRPREDDSTPVSAPTARAPPAPGTIAATGPPG